MSEPLALVILALLLLGPLLLAPLERNLELYFLILGLVAALIAGCLDWEVARKALTEPIPIVIATVGAGVLFARTRTKFDLLFARLRERLPRPLLTALAVMVIAAAASIVTAIVAALILVETTALLRLGDSQRVKVVVLGCFAIALGAVLTPIGEPLSTLATNALGLGFLGLFRLLGAYVIPAMIILSAMAGIAARGDSQSTRVIGATGESLREVLTLGLKVFAFIAGLVLVGEAFAPIAGHYVSNLDGKRLYWANTVSAALDNATLVALEFHRLPLERARFALLSLLISGGMLIPGNIPNIVCAGSLHISSYTWARVGVPLGALLLGIYFALLIY